MIKNILTNLCAIAVFGCVAFSQTPYSESTSYKPRPAADSDKKKKPEKKKAEPTAEPAVVSGSGIVTIPVSVWDKTGVLVNGLTKADLNIFVDGVEVPVVGFERSRDPLNVILLLDSSPSAMELVKTMKEQAWKLVQALPSNARVTVIDFNSKMNVRTEMTSDRAATQAAITKIKMGDGTSLYSAIRTMYDKVIPQVPGRKVIVLMSDGVDTTSTGSTFANSLREVEKGDVSYYPIYFDTFRYVSGVRNRQTDPRLEALLRQLGNPGMSEDEYKIGLAYLNDLAVQSGGRVLSSEKIDDAAIRLLIDELSSKYYATVSVPKTGTGSRQLKVRINRPGLTVFARGSFIEQ